LSESCVLKLLYFQLINVNLLFEFKDNSKSSLCTIINPDWVNHLKANPGVKDLARPGIEPCTFQFSASFHSRELRRPLSKQVFHFELIERELFLEFEYFLQLLREIFKFRWVVVCKINMWHIMYLHPIISKISLVRSRLSFTGLMMGLDHWVTFLLLRLGWVGSATSWSWKCLIIYLCVKKSHRVASTNTLVKVGSAPYLLWVRSLLRSGHGLISIRDTKLKLFMLRVVRQFLFLVCKLFDVGLLPSYLFQYFLVF